MRAAAIMRRSLLESVVHARGRSAFGKAMFELPLLREQVFEMFVRLHDRESYEGTGIGLAICKKIAELHHGSIAVSSTLNEGSTFTITLPVHQPKPVQA